MTRTALCPHQVHNAGLYRGLHCRSDVPVILARRQQAIRDVQLYGYAVSTPRPKTSRPVFWHPKSPAPTLCRRGVHPNHPDPAGGPGCCSLTFDHDRVQIHDRA